MASPSGCFKPALYGCLGLIGLLVLLLAIGLGLAWYGAERQDPVAITTGEDLAPPTGAVPLPDLAGGLVVLDIGQAEVRIEPAAPDQAAAVHASFDRRAYELVDRYEEQDDGSWVYRLSFRRTVPWFETLLQGLLGRGTQPRLEILLPPDQPLSLDLDLQQGGAEVELGGLWLREASFTVRQGGLALAVGRPLREPMERLVLAGKMGGVSATGLGNASPRELTVDYRMGGADLDLDGAWRGDCRGSFAVHMGGISLNVPEELTVVDAAADTAGAPVRLEEPAERREAPAPTLRITTRASRGEVEVRRY